MVRATFEALVTASIVTASIPPVRSRSTAASKRRVRDRSQRGSTSSSLSADEQQAHGSLVLSALELDRGLANSSGTAFQKDPPKFAAR